MARSSDAMATVVDQQALVQGVAKYFIEKVYGPDGMPWGTKFADLEELSVQIGQAISRSMMDQALARQAQAVPAEAEACSGCGGRVESGGRHGATAHAHPGGHDPMERAETILPSMPGGFFPPDPGVGDRLRRL